MSDHIKQLNPIVHNFPPEVEAKLREKFTFLLDLVSFPDIVEKKREYQKKLMQMAKEIREMGIDGEQALGLINSMVLERIGYATG